MPSEIRERHNWHSGTPLIAVDTEVGVVVMSTDEALSWLRTRVEGRDLVAELLAERRADVKRSAG
jgi:bifunctional DNA-binding transcriptional regulator/antitoxin component of YhaV-PrlF toxin-antitoxin module